MDCFTILRGWASSCQLATEEQGVIVRQVRAERTRAAALDAAIDILIESGYSGLTTRTVQQRSDLSRGALLHHFPTRGDLLAATVDELVERRAARAQQIIDTFRADPPADRFQAALDAVYELASAPDFLAETELWAAARSDPEFLTALQPVAEAVAARLYVQLTELFGPELAAHPEFPVFALATVELGRGLVLSAPVRGGLGDRAVLDFWRRGALALLAPDREPSGG